MGLVFGTLRDPVAQNFHIRGVQWIVPQVCRRHAGGEIGRRHPQKKLTAVRTAGLDGRTTRSGRNGGSVAVVQTQASLALCGIGTVAAKAAVG